MKKSRLIILSLIAAIGLLLCVGCVRPAAGPSLAAAPTPVESPQIDALKSQLEEAQEELASYKLREANWEYWQKVSDFLQKTMAGVSRTRGLPAPEHVEMRVVTADWAKKKWGDDYVREDSRKIQIDQRIFQGLLVLPEDARLADLYASWPRSYLAAALGDKVYFVQENFGALNGDDIRKTLAHEVVHLLQKGFETPKLATYDDDKAWSALVEGDADFTWAKYFAETAQERPPEFGRLRLAAPAAPAAAPEPARPPALTRLLYFSYEYGQAFVSGLYQKGGWSRVNEAFQKRPTATQQVMHPDKYLAGESPRGIRPLSLNIPGAQEERVDRLGEYFIRVMLETWLSAPEAVAAAQGWAGDRLTYYERLTDYLLTWQTAWDSDGDAAEFYQALLKVLGRAGAAAGGLWSAQGKYFSVRQTGAQGVLVIASKEKSLVEAAVAALP